MAKFYVQSGEIAEVIHAVDSQAAALWLMNTVMETFFPAVADATLAPVEIGSDPFEYLEDGLLLLGEEIFVSEQGFDRLDSDQFDSIEIFTEWNELILAVAKLEKSFSAENEELAIG